MTKVCVTLPNTIGDGAEFLADVRALDAAGADMVRLEGDGQEEMVLLGAIVASSHRLRIWVSIGVPPAALEKLGRGRVVAGQPPGESWVSIPLPPTRDAWAAALREHDAAAVTGVVVPWEPRLIDLLRNPEPEDRSDLLMSTG